MPIYSQAVRIVPPPMPKGLFTPPETDGVNRMVAYAVCQARRYIRWRIARQMTTRKLSANLYICTNMITLVINAPDIPL